MKEIGKLILIAAFFLAGMKLVATAEEQGASLGALLTNSVVSEPGTMTNMMTNQMMNQVGNQVMNQVMPEIQGMMMNTVEDTQ